MTLDEIRQKKVFQTRGIAEAIKEKPSSYRYVLQCLQRLYNGDYGEIPAEDTDANNAELEAGEGRIVARYKAKYSLEDDIYIIACFSQEIPGIDANHVMIMYVTEY
jgi:hypothetical protein